jgi:hypothetical protein
MKYIWHKLQAWLYDRKSRRYAKEGKFDGAAEARSTSNYHHYLAKK